VAEPAEELSVLTGSAVGMLSCRKNFGSNGRQNRNTISTAPAVQKACLLARRFAVGLRRCCCGDCLFIRVHILPPRFCQEERNAHFAQHQVGTHGSIGHKMEPGTEAAEQQRHDQRTTSE